MKNIIKVEYNGVELGAIIRSTYHNSGIGFFLTIMMVYN